MFELLHICHCILKISFAHFCHDSNVRHFYPHTHKRQFDVKRGSFSMDAAPYYLIIILLSILLYLILLDPKALGKEWGVYPFFSKKHHPLITTLLVFDCAVCVQICVFFFFLLFSTSHTA